MRRADAPSASSSRLFSTVNIVATRDSAATVRVDPEGGVAVRHDAFCVTPSGQPFTEMPVGSPPKAVLEADYPVHKHGYMRSNSQYGQGAVGSFLPPVIRNL